MANNVNDRPPAEPGSDRWWEKPYTPSTVDLQKLARLSEREIEVARLLAAGMTCRAIAVLLHLSSKTVDTHRGNVMRKLELGGNADIARFCVRVGVLGLGGEP
jgi:DNA-binding CsgD family transcriptional regulator